MLMVQTGFNHNIRYKQILFHVQTEDYGVQKHLVVTQLFFGGTLVHKTQMDYSEFVDLEDMGEQVHELMKVQHIKMLKDLVNGMIVIPDWILNQGAAKPVVKQVSSNPNDQPIKLVKATLDLDTSPIKEETFEVTVSRFLDEDE